MISVLKSKIILAASLFFVAAVVLVTVVVYPAMAKPQLQLVPAAASISAADREEFVIDVCLTDLPDNNYPAASISVEFDRNKLEFVGVKQGNMMTEDGSGGFDIPVWSCNPEVSNRKGQINAMYLDMTAGDRAYVLAGYNKQNANVLLRLTFKLRDSATKGDSLKFTVQDAAVATVGGDVDNTSLSTAAKTLNTKNCSIKID